MESKEKSRGLLGLLKRKTVGGKRGRKGKERREKEEEEGEREEGGEEEEKGGEGPSFLTASMSLPNIAGELNILVQLCVTSVCPCNMLHEIPLHEMRLGSVNFF